MYVGVSYEMLLIPQVFCQQTMAIDFTGAITLYSRVEKLAIALLQQNQSMSVVQSGHLPVGVILLAAGGSSRLGQPKQLVEYKGRSLLEHSVKTALSSNAQLTVVVLGANANAFKEEIKENKVHIVVNTAWQTGMASSIQSGLKEFTAICPSAEGVVLMVCDQPFVTASLLNDLLEAHKKTGKPIIACSYENTFGPPVFFHHVFFPALLQLEGDVGARGVIRQHADDVEVVPFPEGRFDVDTKADYEIIKAQVSKTSEDPGLNTG